jgi:hypothetical protein
LVSAMNRVHGKNVLNFWENSIFLVRVTGGWAWGIGLKSVDEAILLPAEDHLYQAIFSSLRHVIIGITFLDTVLSIQMSQDVQMVLGEARLSRDQFDEQFKSPRIVKCWTLRLIINCEFFCVTEKVPVDCEVWAYSSQNRFWCFLCCWKSEDDSPVRWIIDCERFCVHSKSGGLWSVRYGKVWTLETGRKWSGMYLHQDLIVRRSSVARACDLRKWEKWYRFWK